MYFSASKNRKHECFKVRMLIMRRLWAVINIAPNWLTHSLSYMSILLYSQFINFFYQYTHDLINSALAATNHQLFHMHVCFTVSDERMKGIEISSHPKKFVSDWNRLICMRAVKWIKARVFFLSPSIFFSFFCHFRIIFVIVHKSERKVRCESGCNRIRWSWILLNSGIQFSLFLSFI